MLASHRRTTPVPRRLPILDVSLLKAVWIHPSLERVVLLRGRNSDDVGNGIPPGFDREMEIRNEMFTVALPNKGRPDRAAVMNLVLDDRCEFGVVVNIAVHLRAGFPLNPVTSPNVTRVVHLRLPVVAV